MDNKESSSDLSQAEHPPTQEEQVPSNPPSRKRQLDSDDAEPRAKRARPTSPEPARLTRQNLARFNKMGKKSSDSSDPSNPSESTNTLSTTASGFAIRARNNGILKPISSKPPTNLEEIHVRLARSRQSTSPSESVYRRYTRKVATARNEATMVFEVGKNLLKEYDDGYNREFKQAFTGFPKDVGFNNGLSAPQPDFIEGLEMEEFRPFPVDHISGVLYKDDPQSITLPHIAGEWKARGRNIEEAALKSSYDGAALVYARNQVHSTYLGKSDPAGHAHVTTFTTNGTHLNFYAHYAAPSAEEDNTPKYHQYLIKTTNLTGSHQEYKEGRKHLRDEQDYARKQSYELRDELKEYYRKQRGLHAVVEGVPSLPIPGIEPLDAHEDEGDDEVIQNQPAYQPTPPISSKHKNSKIHSHSTTYPFKAPSAMSHHAPDSTSCSAQKRKAPSSQGSSSGSFRHSKYQKLLDQG